MAYSPRREGVVHNALYRPCERKEIDPEAVIPGRAKREPGISRFRVWC
jgi:hypothetical protein